jgi:hypothetical protein
MAQHYNSFATCIDCPDEDKANALRDTILKMLDEEEYVEIPDMILVEKLRDQWYVYLAGHDGLSDRIPPIIQSYLKLWGLDSKIVISGGYGCSKLRPGEFGGWACGITATSVDYVSADFAMRMILSGKC